MQIREISRDAGVYTDQELRAILKFYHSYGKITFFGEKYTGVFDLDLDFNFLGDQHGGSPVLRDTIIFSPAAFSQIVYRLTARIYFNKMVK